MKRLVVLAFFTCGCELADEAARRPGELKRSAVVEPTREESILNDYFTQEYAQRKIAHLASTELADFDSVSQPRPRIADIVSRFGEADGTEEIDLSPFGVPDRALVYRFGRLGRGTPVQRADGENFWTLIAAESQ